MKSGSDLQSLHDELIAQIPAGQTHEACQLCPEPLMKKEVAQVAGEDRTYTEAEHLALMADAVTRETAAVREAKESAEATLGELKGRVDVLEAEKAAAETKVSEVQAAFDTFKADVERAREVETAKKDRLDKVKAAHDGLPDSYFTDERIQRWAEMTEEAFASLIDDLAAAKGANPVKETAAFSGGDAPKSPDAPRVGSLFAARRGEKN